MSKLGKISAALAALGIMAMMSPSLAGDARHGKEVYQSTCIACHGEDGAGAIPGTPNFKEKSGVLAKSDEVLIRNMIEGYESPGSMMAMPPFGGDPDLSEQDIADVLAYIRSAF